MMDATKYRVGYFPVDEKYHKWVEKDHIEKPPVWCSVDMRDGNQSLVIPMSLEEKLDYYKVLLAVGFKEIEVGFPAASETEYEFLRTLIDNHLIPNEADSIEHAVSAYLDQGYRTADIMSKGMTLVGCKQCGDIVINCLKKE